MKKWAVFTGICSAVCLGWALGIFFGLNYPEIHRETVFVETNCSVGAPVTVVPYRYCDKYCSDCAESHSNVTCSSKSALDWSMDKYDLSPATEARIEGRCNDGYNCCEEHCDTCQFCIQTGLDDDDDDDDDKTCFPYDCNCYCAESTDDLRCTFLCMTQFETHVPVTFLWRPNGAPPIDPDNEDDFPIPADQIVVNTTAVRDFAADQGEAREYLSKRFPAEVRKKNGTTASYPCAYNPTWNPRTDVGPYNQITEVSQLAFFDWELGYTPGWWLLFGFPAFFVMLLLMFCTGEACRLYCCRDRYGHSQAWCHGRERLVPFWNAALWFGTLLPFALFLPIELKGKLVDRDTASVALNWTVYVLCALGWAPMMILFTATRFQIYDQATTIGGSSGAIHDHLLQHGGSSSSSSSSRAILRSSSCIRRFFTAFGRSSIQNAAHMHRALFVVLFGWVVPVAGIAPLPYCEPWGLLHPLPLGLVFAILGLGPEVISGCPRLLGGFRNGASERDPGMFETLAVAVADSLRQASHRLRVKRIHQEIRQDVMPPVAVAIDAASLESNVLQGLDPFTVAQGELGSGGEGKRRDSLSGAVHAVAAPNVFGHNITANMKGVDNSNALPPVPLYYPTATATISTGGGAAWDPEAEELIIRVCTKVNSTSELLKCFEMLGALNSQGKMSQVQRGSLIAGIVDRRKNDRHFREVVWTIPQTSEAYGRLLMS